MAKKKLTIKPKTKLPKKGDGGTLTKTLTNLNGNPSIDKSNYIKDLEEKFLGREQLEKGYRLKELVEC